ncbi:hypothetical protein Hanom_Chr10g00887481 [Helianthus anomalus]
MRVEGDLHESWVRNMAIVFAYKARNFSPLQVDFAFAFWTCNIKPFTICSDFCHCCLACKLGSLAPE